MALWIRSRSELFAALVLSLAVALAPGRALAADAAETKSRELYKEAQKLFDVGQFDKALELYTEAYKLKQLPGFLFNIAQCHRQMGNWERAGFFFGRFIDNSNPRAPNIEVARELLEDARRKQNIAAEEARVAEEKKRAEEEKRAAAEEEDRRRKEDELRRANEARQAQLALPPPPPPPAEEPVTKKPVFWVVLVGGVLAVAGGTTAIVVATTSKRGGPPALTNASLGTIDAR